MTTTATVETLTAEVRVLMVGSRQVTLSVAKQLDVVPLAELIVFGRVRLGREHDYVIGADRQGRLALATYNRFGHLRMPAISAEDLSGDKVTVCRRSIDRDGWTTGLTFGDADSGVRVSFTADALQPCEFKEHDNWSGDRCGHWRTNGLDREIQRMVDLHAAEVGRHVDAAAAPLIVLAGLR